MNANINHLWVEVAPLSFEVAMRLMDWRRDAWSNGERYIERNTDRQLGFRLRDGSRAWLNPDVFPDARPI